MITLTTTGNVYIFQITHALKIVASAVAICGIAVIALPAGIFASAFSDAVQRGREDKGS